MNFLVLSDKYYCLARSAEVEQWPCAVLAHVLITDVQNLQMRSLLKP